MAVLVRMTMSAGTGERRIVAVYTAVVPVSAPMLLSACQCTYASTRQATPHYHCQSLTRHEGVVRWQLEVPDGQPHAHGALDDHYLAPDGGEGAGGGQQAQHALAGQSPAGWRGR